MTLPVYPGTAVQRWRTLLSSLFLTVTWETDVWWILWMSGQTTEAISVYSTLCSLPFFHCKKVSITNSVSDTVWSADRQLWELQYQGQSTLLQGPKLWHIHSLSNKRFHFLQWNAYLLFLETIIQLIFFCLLFSLIETKVIPILLWFHWKTFPRVSEPYSLRTHNISAELSLQWHA